MLNARYRHDGAVRADLAEKVIDMDTFSATSAHPTIVTPKP
jgi:hypothetical protein